MKTYFPRRNGHSERGVALVITLIFLAVITTMAITFLVVSRRDAEQVDYLTQQTNAKFMANSGADSAVARVMAHMLSTINGYDFGLQVSTNYNADTNYARLGNRSITNVGYYANYPNRVLVSGTDLQAMLNNQLILPRPPVFISTNASPNAPYDFRYYLDLNRNGVFEPSGLQLQLTNGRAVLTPNNLPVYSQMVGDPQFVGVLDHPDAFHSSSNYFIGRYAWIAMPIGNSLDINYIHNDSRFLSSTFAKTAFGDGSDDGYIRNQGVGPWEINLAGFLNSLNPSVWDYSYSITNLALGNPGPSAGLAFANAASILHYRYNGSVTNLGTLGAEFPNGYRFTNQMIDYFGSFPLMLGSIPSANYVNPTNLFWGGSDNPSAFATTQDPFNQVGYSASPATFPSFASNLFNIGRGAFTNTTFHRYTYYRMLSQLGMGSAPESSGKLNLNFVNAGTSLATTNLVPWTPVQFFTNAAIRMIQARPEFVAENLCSSNRIHIPVYPTNFYTPAVHRLLQLAANIYDASTNKSAYTPFFDYPSVFAPQFSNEVVRLPNGSTYKSYYISGYQLVTPANNIKLLSPPFGNAAILDLRRTNGVNNDLGVFVNDINSGRPVNVYGVPYIVGAKKGFPNINSFSMVPEIQMQRKMAIVKNAGNPTSHALWQTNVQYTLGISNSFGVGCWNSYTNLYYGRNVRVFVTDNVDIVLTNQLGQVVASAYNLLLSNQFDIGTNVGSHWSGSPKDLSQATLANSFKLALSTNIVFLGDSVLLNTPPYSPTRAANNATLPIPPSPPNFIPRYYLYVTNRVRVMIADLPNGRGGPIGQLIDYVQLGGLGLQPGLDTYDDLTWDLVAQDRSFSGNSNYWFWQTNSYRAGANQVPIGFQNQLAISQIPLANYDRNVWSPVVYAGVSDTSISNEIAGFVKFLTDSTMISNQVPYTPVAHFTNAYTWSANDPLVHFMASDLLDMNSYHITNSLITNAGVVTATAPLIWNTNTVGVPTPISWGTNTLLGLSWHLNYNRYQPWGSSTTNMAIAKTNMVFKDPLITRSDDWQFLTSEFPNVGWLGRVHRGTPWQTVYLKSGQIPSLATWQGWTGDLIFSTIPYTNFNTGAVTNAPVYDATISAPNNDWELMDLFTTAPTPNASRGRLSINQTNIAAWAAVLDGVIVQTNNTPYNMGATVIDPANYFRTYTTNGVLIGVTNSLQYLVASINAQRTTFPGQVFTNLGDVLSVPALTMASPFLNATNPLPATNNGANWDAAYERIPQQVMSLLTVGTPRYVIYSYGQSLKPAPNSIVTSGPYFGTCTNYQITGEVVTRTIVRFDDPLYSTPNPTVPAINAPNRVVPGQPLVPGMQFLVGQRAVRPVIESVQVLGPE